MQSDEEKRVVMAERLVRLDAMMDQMTEEQRRKLKPMRETLQRLHDLMLPGAALPSTVAESQQLIDDMVSVRALMTLAKAKPHQ
jgi:hypothetical protein